MTWVLKKILNYETRFHLHRNKQVSYNALHRCNFKLAQRILEHKEKRYENSFTTRYNLDKLIYWEAFQEIGDAIGREKQLKADSRQKKIDLINELNPDWSDLYESIQDIMNPF